MEIREINELTRNWTVDEFADFLHYRLQHGDRESIRSWWRSASLLRKLEATGLAGLADDVCRERWTSPDKPFGVRLAAGALVTDGEEADRMLATMAGYERIRFLCAYPRLAVGQRAVDACRVGGDEPLLEYSMTRVPDEYLREALESDRHWGIKLRVDDYKKALRETLLLERLFTGPDSQVLAEVREQVETEIAKEEE